MPTQQTLWRVSEDSPDHRQFVTILSYRTWTTRAQLANLLGWDDRKIRMHAAAMGGALVKGQKGFCLLTKLNREDLGLALRAADAQLAQAKKMLKYSLTLKRNLHRITG